MIIAKSKPLAPGQEGLVMTLDCRVSYFLGAKALSFILVYSILTPVSLDLAKRLNLNPRSWLATLIFLVAVILGWLLYNSLWKRSVTIYDRGQSLEILINHKLYRYDWTSLRRVKTFNAPKRHGGIFSKTAVLKFHGRSFYLTSDDQVAKLEWLIQYLEKGLKRSQKGGLGPNDK
ncbi:hypothetical protein [uncultured Abiotrophia sp.]|uniref:hypothetical protein n=1 Tax=uncultured Abiotrophia sp. TaxID=316094 RepID=UPI0028D36616|nr:hypothetical protein [uncultured Abiotrophia sp.]